MDRLRHSRGRTLAESLLPGLRHAPLHRLKATSRRGSKTEALSAATFWGAFLPPSCEGPVRPSWRSHSLGSMWMVGRWLTPGIRGRGVAETSVYSGFRLGWLMAVSARARLHEGGGVHTRTPQAHSPKRWAPAQCLLTWPGGTTHSLSMPISQWVTCSPEPGCPRTGI